MGNDLGWNPAGAGTVTRDTAIVTALTNGFSAFPIETNHTQVLRLNDSVTDEIQSGAGGTL